VLGELHRGNREDGRQDRNREAVQFHQGIPFEKEMWTERRVTD
jgi:hypothetical protein